MSSAKIFKNKRNALLNATNLSQTICKNSLMNSKKMPRSELRSAVMSIKSVLPSPIKKRAKAAARVISYFYKLAETVYLLSIYDKSETENISDNELKYLIEEIEADFK